MRASRILPGAVAVAFLAASPAAPASHGGRGSSDGTRTVERATGALTITWRGDPARGCAAMGLCDISGSVSYVAGSRESEVISSGDDQSILYDLGFDAVPPVARVLRGDPSDPAGTCVDALPSNSVALVPDDAEARRVRLTASPFAGFGSPALPAGRCAGPAPDDVAGALPSVEVDARRLASGTVDLDLSGRRPFAGGPFSGEVISTLRYHRTSSRVRNAFPPSDETSEEVRPRPVPRGAARPVFLEVRYDVVAIRGALTAGFAGGADPFCVPLDACGLGGTYRLGGLRVARFARLSIYGRGTQRALRGGRGPRAALRALRAGRLAIEPVGFGVPIRGRFSARSGRAGEPACSEGRRIELGGLDLRAAGGRLRLALDVEGMGGGTPLTTRCPGPRDADFGEALASGGFARAAAGRRRLLVPLAAQSALTGPFRIAPRDDLVLELRRRRVVLTTDGGP